jgi:hypothetical protein
MGHEIDYGEGNRDSQDAEQNQKNSAAVPFVSGDFIHMFLLLGTEKWSDSTDRQLGFWIQSLSFRTAYARAARNSYHSVRPRR